MPPPNNTHAAMRAKRAILRMQEAWQKVAEGRTQAEIAADLGVSQQAVSKLLKKAEQAILADVSDTVLAQKVKQTVRLEGLYREAMAAWRASKGEKTKRQRRWRSAPGGDGTQRQEETQIIVEQSHGEVSYLTTAQAIMTDLRRVWGLDAPQKLHHSGAIAKDNDLSKLTDDELEAYYQLVSKMTA